MSFRLTKIDELSRRDHCYLDESDECWFFGEYTAYKDWSFSETNRLIKNFKKEMKLKGTNQWPHKMRAIQQCGNLIASTINPTSNINDCIFVPIPPSSIITDPNYDPRITEALQAASQIAGKNMAISECITQKQNHLPDHLSGETRLTPAERAATYCFDQNKFPVGTKMVVLVDDVITTGSHFKGATQCIKAYYPAVKIVGLFIARRVHQNPFDDLDLTEFIEHLKKS